MGNILYNISEVLGITIIHSLWQGLLIYFVLRIALIATPSLSAEKKYNLAFAAMLCIFVCFVYTLYIEVHTYNWITVKSVSTLPLLPYINLPINYQHFITNQTAYNTIAGYLPYVSILYIAGLAANLLKFSREWNKVRLLKQSLIPAEQMQQYINKLSKKLNITKNILLKFSELIDVPCMIGYFKPIILLPVSIASYLSACEIEAILLHELSHIKRNDYLINVLQQIITVMLFFNPFAQLINRIINQERENGCDDLVIEKTSNPLIYAKALLKLEETCGAKLQLAMSAIGKKYHLLNRIERIMKTKKPIGNIRHLIIAIFLLAGSLGSIAWFNPGASGVNRSASLANKVIAKLNPSNGIEKEQPALKFFEPSPITEKDSNKYILISDTIKHHHKVKTTIAKNGHKKAYDHDIDSAPADSISKVYSSPEWKAQMEAIRKQGEEIRKQFNSPEWKAQMLAMQKQGEEMKKHFESPEWKAQVEAMKRQGEEMKKQFQSPEWKAQVEAMKRQGEEMKKHFESPEWKAQVEAMKRQGEEMKKHFQSPEWKAQVEAMKGQAEEMKKYFQSPEWKAQMENMKKQGEEMQKQFKRQWKYNMKDMKWDAKDSVNNQKPEKEEKPEKKN